MAILLAEAYLHNLDPFAIKFPASWPIAGLRWYGLAYLAGFAVGWLGVTWLARTHRTAIPVRAVSDMMIYILIGVLVGGRLGYCVFYDPALLTQFTPKFPFWGLLAINEGGMSSHGGMIGVVVTMWIFAVRNNLSKLHLMDVVSFTAAPGLFFGRLANVVNAELWGRVLPASMQQAPPWWSIKYPQEITSWSADKLARLTEAVEAAGFTAAQWRSALDRMEFDADAELFVRRTINRLIEAVQSGDQAVITVMRPELLAYYPSQLLQAITDGPLLFLLMIVVWRIPRKPGIVGAWFLGGYGVMRIISERFREPDAGVQLLATPLGDFSRGQLLSLLMVAVAVVGGVIVARREVEPIGGLFSGPDRG